MNIVFNNEKLKLNKLAYSNGRPAFELVDMEGMPYMTATTNIPELPLPENHTFIKNYSENTGILPILIDAGIVRDTGEAVESGFVTIPIVEVL